MIEAVNPLGVDNPLEKPYSFTLEEMKIKGIIKDIHMESLYESIKPMIFVYEPSKGSSFAYTLIEVSTDHIQETIAEVEKSWTKHIPEPSFPVSILRYSIRQPLLFRNSIRENFRDIHHHCYPHFVFGPLRLGYIYGAIKNQRSWRKKSARRECSPNNSSFQ